MVRRMTWRNERSLYSRTCDLCQKSMVSMYKPSDIPVYCHECWYSDKWEAMEKGKEFDPEKPFLEQWHKLMCSVPHLNLWKIQENVGSEFTNYSANNRNCYLSYSVISSENVCYSYSVDKDKDSFDNLYLKSSELCYENIDGTNNYNCLFCMRSRDTMNSSFLFDCTNCQDCFMSSNLKNKQYVFRGEQLTKEGYKEAMGKVELDNHSELEKLKREFRDMIREESIHKYAHVIRSEHCTGDNIENCKNVRDAFEGYDSENVRYGVRLGQAKDSMDFYGLVKGELAYEVIAPGFESSKNLFGFLNNASRDIYYSSLCASCTDCFGCVGLKNKQYCILNKQYSKEEYEKLISEIRKHMSEVPYKDSRGRAYPYGEFFPGEFSPFAYNESIAQENFTLSKEEALERGYSWHDAEEKKHQPSISAGNLPEKIGDAEDSVLKEVIECSHKGECNHQCTKAFKIIPAELQFYRRVGLPLPRLCPNCRHYERLAQRNPLKLWERNCMCDYETYKNSKVHPHHEKGRCPNTFKTAYPPDGKEIVYCEECYQEELV